ncbi:MAG: MBL fold metallo-hydrolase, partial [Planctomycetes bacterium]|nr:MBL fold metallo-hydrolase [Planctomycetota bacterium]
VWSRLPSREPSELKVTGLDVGQGNCVFVGLPSGQNLLYDAGTAGSFDVGRNVVAPFLWHEGVRTIDALFISHPHGDHDNGVPALLERFRVRRVFVNEQFGQSKSGPGVLDAIRGHGIAVTRVAQGDRIEFAGGVSATVLFPPAHVSRRLALSTNDLSTVLRLDWRDRRVLLCGDVQTNGIHLLLKSGPDLACDMIQVPHHGLRARNSDDLAKSAQPRFALVSALGHIPSEDTLRAYRRAKSLVLPTHAMGGVTMSFGRDGRVTANGFVFGPILDSGR